MKRAHEPGESQKDQLENEKRARENDGGKHDGSIKSSRFQHVMEVTEDMFKIPEVHGFKKIRNQKYRLSHEI